MLRVRKARPEGIKVSLPGGAFAMVRPATAAEVDRASAEVRALVAGAAASADSLALVSLALGEEFSVVDLAEPGRLEQVGRGLMRLKLAHLCCESWSGIGDENGAPLELCIENLALLLREARIAAAFDAAVERAIHVEAEEKNASAASPSGGAAAATVIAPNAGAA